MAQHTLKGTTTAGTPVKLSTFLGANVSGRCAWLIIQWKTGNAGNMYVGDPKTALPFSANAPGIGGGNSVTLPYMGAPGTYDFTTILIDSDNNGDFLILYGRS